MKVKLAVLISLLLLLPSCSTGGIKPIKMKSYAQEKRAATMEQAFSPRFGIVSKGNASTNIIPVALKNSAGKTITTVDFVVIRPADLERVEVKGDVKSGEFWKGFFVNQALAILILVSITFLFGWSNVVSFLKKTFAKS